MCVQNFSSLACLEVTKKFVLGWWGGWWNTWLLSLTSTLVSYGWGLTKVIKERPIAQLWIFLVTGSWTGQYEKAWWPYADANNKTGAESSCNQLRGTDGHQFPPFVNKDDQPELWLFNTVPCRSIFMKYQEEVEIEGQSWFVPPDI